MDEKSTGSYYTPQILIEFMLQFINSKRDYTSVLEPSAGDGRFLYSLTNKKCRIHAIEVDEKKVEFLQECNFSNTMVTCADFIDYSLSHDEEYDIIIGNPPYISKRNLEEESRQLSLRLMDYYGLPSNIFQNLWVSFILASIKILAPDGSIFFVLPFEFLQVQYAEKLRNYLETRFNSIEIITFEEKIFENIEQDVCLVYLENKANQNPYIMYTTINDLEKRKSNFSSVIKRNKPLKKWSNCILNDYETELISIISSKYPQISEFGDISPGIVTGANEFFIIDKNAVQNLKLEDSYLRIISKSTDVADRLIFTKEDFNELYLKKKVALINLRDVHENEIDTALMEYLKKGEDKKISERYKCKKRKRWFDVPVVKKGDACFFKRYDKLPRIIVNEAHVYTSDISYNLRFHENIDAASFAFCFYNSLTLVLCEYNGRFYGGGVAELVPSEFKSLHMPYRNIKQEHIVYIDNMLRQKDEMAKIIDYVDNIVLDVTQEQKEILQSIRNRYLERRIKYK